MHATSGQICEKHMLPASKDVARTELLQLWDTLGLSLNPYLGPLQSADLFCWTHCRNDAKHCTIVMHLDSLAQSDAVCGILWQWWSAIIQSAIKPQARNSGYYVHSIDQLVMKGLSISNHFRLSYRYVQYWLSVIAKMNQQHWPITFLAFPKTSWSKSAMQTEQLRCCPFSRINHRINLPIAAIPICIWGESAAGWTGTSLRIWISQDQDDVEVSWNGGYPFELDFPL